MSQMSDDQLIQEVQAYPDSPALRVLFERYRPILLNLQRRYYVPGHDADDWEQEALLVLHTVVQRYDQRRSRSFGAFYRLNLTHRFFDLIRYSQAKKRRARTVSLDQHSSYFADTLTDSRIHLRDHLETQETLHRVMATLSVTERLVMGGLLAGWTPQRICERHQLTPHQVSSAIHRGRTKLQQSFAE